MSVERERRENCGLLRSVKAFDVRCGIGFRVTQILSHLKRRIHRLTERVDAVKNEVRRAVDDSQDARDPVPRERFTERANDRDGAGDRCFIEDLCADL